MSNQRFLVILLLGTYFFSPSIFTWMIDPDGRWYRPYILWGLVILTAFILDISSRRRNP